MVSGERSLPFWHGLPTVPAGPWHGRETVPQQRTDHLPQLYGDLDDQ